MSTSKALRKAAHAIAPLVIGAIVMTFVSGTSADAVAHAAPVPAVSGFAGVSPVNVLVAAQLTKPSAVASFRPSGPLFGIFQPEVPWKASITRAIHRSLHPQIVQVYTRFGAKFKIRAARIDHYNGALTIFQFDPRHVSLRRIATGHYDAYLKRYARSVKRLHFKIAISFAHEMNGNWYSWGYSHSGTRNFVNAWRRIHRIFSHLRVRNVLWVWTINKLYLHNSKRIIQVTRRDWPGKAYVNWVGIDGYFRFPGWGFNQVFKPTIRLVKTITKKPIILTETAVSVSRRRAQLREIFAGIKRDKLHGFVYFDANARSKWSLHGRSITLVRRLVRRYGYRKSRVP